MWPALHETHVLKRYRQDAVRPYGFWFVRFCIRNQVPSQLVRTPKALIAAAEMRLLEAGCRTSVRQKTLSLVGYVRITTIKMEALRGHHSKMETHEELKRRMFGQTQSWAKPKATGRNPESLRLNRVNLSMIVNTTGQLVILVVRFVITHPEIDWDSPIWLFQNEHLKKDCPRNSKRTRVSWCIFCDSTCIVPITR